MGTYQSRALDIFKKNYILCVARNLSSFKNNVPVSTVTNSSFSFTTLWS
jgi:hypothetical protein